MRLKLLNKQQKKFLLAAPVVVLPFICLIFFVLGGGKGKPEKGGVKRGLNPELPAAWSDLKSAFRNKYQQYEKADQDSLKKKAYQRQDPYRQDSTAAPVPDTQRKRGYVTLAQPVPKINNGYTDPKATELLKQLDRLQQSLHQPSPVNRPLSPPGFPPAYPTPAHRPDTARDNAPLDRLNAMLDKVIRIQHPGQGRPAANEGLSAATDEILPADSGANTIAAVVPEQQTLVSGATIALRVTDPIRVNGLPVPPGQRVYGVASVAGDRLKISISAIYHARSVYTTELEVYDLDGLAGIHIPGTVDREVAKQSADQGVSSLNTGTFDGSLGAQAANAGVQTAKTLLSRKVRLVRVTIPAGYHVLIRGRKRPAAPGLPKANSLESPPLPPGFVPYGPFLQRCRVEGVELGLQGIFLIDNVLWFALTWKNGSSIRYVAEYVRWTIRDRKRFKRTAIQELVVEPVCAPTLPVVSGDWASHAWAGFQPFALARDKELVLEVGEKGGARVLTLVIDHNKLLKAKRYDKDKRDPADATAADPVH